MLDFDKWQEILGTMRKNKLRTFLTGFAIAWGILMLMILLGAGNGLSNGVGSNFEGNAINAMWISGRETSLPFAGYKAGRRIQIKTSDYEEIKAMKEIDKISPRYWIGNRTYAYQSEYGDYTTQSCNPDFQYIENYQISNGRFINEMDMKYERKVLVIGDDIRKGLFKNEDPIGKYINVGDIPFRVIGVYNEIDPRGGTRQGLIPLATAQRLYNAGDRIHNLALTTFDMSKSESERLEKRIRNMLAEKHQFDPKDQRALSLYNNLPNYVQTMNIFRSIKIFVWIIGIFTLIAGIVGVSNIMLIVVKERTKEFGIRKAIGASPRSIVGLVILEALIITVLAGYIGMILGISIMEGINFAMERAAEAKAASTDRGTGTIFLNPTVDLRIALSSMLLLVGAGTLAGYLPARRAAAIKPIVALRDE